MSDNSITRLLRDCNIHSCCLSRHLSLSLTFIHSSLHYCPPAVVVLQPTCSCSPCCPLSSGRGSWTLQGQHCFSLSASCGTALEKRSKQHYWFFSRCTCRVGKHGLSNACKSCTRDLCQFNISSHHFAHALQ